MSHRYGVRPFAKRRGASNERQRRKQSTTMFFAEMQARRQQYVRYARRLRHEACPSRPSVEQLLPESRRLQSRPPPRMHLRHRFVARCTHRALRTAAA